MRCGAMPKSPASKKYADAKIILEQNYIRCIYEPDALSPRLIAPTCCPHFEGFSLNGHYLNMYHLRNIYNQSERE